MMFAHMYTISSDLIYPPITFPSPIYNSLDSPCEN